jgi:hypothetical protein
VRVNHRTDILIKTFDSKAEATSAMHEMANTLVRADMTDTHGLYVATTNGVWAVWIRDRRKLGG